MSYSFYFFLFFTLFLAFVGWLLKCIIDFKNRKIKTTEYTSIAIFYSPAYIFLPYAFFYYIFDFHDPQYSDFTYIFYVFFTIGGHAIFAIILNRICNRKASAIQNEESMGAKIFPLALVWGLMNSFIFYLLGSSLLIPIGNSYFHSETTINCRIVKASETRRTGYHYIVKPINEKWEETLLPINKESIDATDLFTLDLTQRMCAPLVHLFYIKLDKIMLSTTHESYKRQNELIGDTIEVSFLKGYFGDIAKGQNPFFTEE